MWGYKGNFLIWLYYSSTHTSAVLTALLWQIPSIQKGSLTVSSSRQRLTIKSTRGWGKKKRNGTWRGMGKCHWAHLWQSQENCALLPPALHFTPWITAVIIPFVLMGPLQLQSATFVAVILKRQDPQCLFNVYLYLFPSALKSMPPYVFRSKLYLIFIFK